MGMTPQYWRHSGDEWDQAFPAFLHSSTSVCYYRRQTEVGLGTRLTETHSTVLVLWKIMCVLLITSAPSILLQADGGMLCQSTIYVWLNHQIAYIPAYQSIQVTLDLLLITDYELLIIKLWLQVISWCNLFWREVLASKKGKVGGRGWV